MKPKEAQERATRHFHARVDLNSLPEGLSDDQRYLIERALNGESAAR